METGRDLARHYASADLLPVPSLSKTFGNVVLEGMASGLACAVDHRRLVIPVRLSGRKPLNLTEWSC